MALLFLILIDAGLTRTSVLWAPTAFENSGGPLRDRLLGALHAGRQASEEGGLHSAALLVISPRARFATRHRLVDLRVDFVDDDAVAALEILRFKIDSIYEIN